MDKLKFLNDLKNVSRHCGGPYNIKNEHFEHFLGAVSAPPPMSCRVKVKTHDDAQSCMKI